MPPPPPSEATFWKRKLAAFLHDSPDKVLGILDHENRARRIAGEIPPDERSRREADWAASAADRLPFPPSKDARSPLSRFIHPLGLAELQLDESSLPVDVAEDNSQMTRPKLNEDDPRGAFIATWRFWRNWAAARRADFALYPADTRLPDHTIWNHLAVTSAMQGCLGGEPWKPGDDTGVADSPAFLLFSIGPVQEFISAARLTRDLWSGSYLLSYLIGHALKRIALDFGPDHVIFPNLCDQPIIDLLLREEIWNRVSTTEGQALFDAFDYYGTGDGRQRLLTPSLPNRFLAILPAAMNEHRGRGAHFATATTYARYLVDDLRRFLTETLADAVAREAKACLGDRFKKERFDRQAAHMLEIHWQLLPWPSEFAGAEALAESLPPDDATVEYTPRAGLATVADLCRHGADTRYLAAGKPRNVAAAWSALYAATDWLLGAGKSTRAFSAPDTGHSHPSKDNSKDSLNGREEAVLIVGDESDAATLSGKLWERLGKNHLLKPGEILGASTLIKRLWPYAELCRRHAFQPGDLDMPNTRSLASREPWSEGDDGENLETAAGEKYFAVLALDGDAMGKWVSGSKTPALEDVLSEECAAAFREKGANLTSSRPLSPSWHLQFSEALGNFSQHAARRIVEAFDGRLIYSGGDDVLAMLPAETALECARALRLAFRGDPAVNNVARGIPVGHRKSRRSDRTTPLFQIETRGFLRLAPQATSRHGAQARLLDDPVNFPVIVPGPAADCSVGVAIAHFKSPLQDVVRAAQAAEKRAKRQLGRSAIAVSLFKRSGEILEWGAKWDDGGLLLHDAIATALDAGQLSAKFPHRVCEIIAPFITAPTAHHGRIKHARDDVKDFPTVEILRQEFVRCLRQHENKQDAPNRKHLAELLAAYLASVSKANGSPSHLIEALTGLLTAVAFAHRTRPTVSDAQEDTAP